MANNNSPASLDKWREFFRGANSDIFDIIKHAIMVAVTDCPNEFKMNRDQIAELLFACKSTKCFGCDRVELALPNEMDAVHHKSRDDDLKCKSGIETATKESKANGSRDDQREVVVEMMNGISNCSYGDVEALTDDLEEESQLFGEVLRIKDVLDNYKQESEEVLFNSLRRLELMAISVETLKDTEIGKSVAALRGHSSVDIKKFAKRLVLDWKVMVDEFYIATQAIAGAEVTPESGKKSIEGEEDEEEGGLPSPPLEEGAFLTTVNDMELSQFFDGMDDDGNLRNSGEFKQNRANGRKPNVAKPNIPRTKLESHNDLSSFPKDRKAETNRNQEPLLRQAPAGRPNRPTGVESGPGRPKPPTSVSGPGRPKPVVQSRANNEMKMEQKPYQGSTQLKQAAPKLEKSNGSISMNIEVAKRKLQERYQQAENAKKQRTIQVVELCDLPKQGVPQRNQNMRPGNQSRHRGNNRM